MKTRIDNYFELRRIFWTTLLLTLSGSIALMLSPITILKVILIASGFLVSSVLFLSVLNYNDEINKTIKKNGDHKMNFFETFQIIMAILFGIMMTWGFWRLGHPKEDI